MATKHGETYGRIYNTWRGMVGRCTQQSHRQFHRYGGRGIEVCREWMDAATFIKWAKANGWADGLQIDRIDNDGHYEPGNCRFVSSKQNGRNRCNNRLICFQGTTKTLSEWSEDTGIGVCTLRSRIDRYGWTIEQALTTPLQQGKKP